MPKFTRQEDIAEWLRTVSESVARVFAARVALRALPALATEFDLHGTQLKDREQARAALRTFRRLQLAWVFSAFQARPTTLDRIVRSIAAESSEGTTYVQRSASYAVGACHGYNPNEFATAATNYAIEVLGFSRQSFDDMLEACSVDASKLDQRANPVELVHSQLWPRRVPAWAFEAWNKLKRALLIDGEHWRVWTDWYGPRLEGLPANQSWEMVRALIPNAMWEQEPALLNTHIQEILRQQEVPRKAGEPDSLLQQLDRLKPQELSVIGVRVALRVIPLLKISPAEFETSLLSALQDISLAWIWARYFTLVSNRAYTIESRSHVQIVRDISQVLAATGPTPEDAPLRVSRAIDSLRTAVLLADGEAGASVFDLCLTQDLNDLRGAPDATAVAELPIWAGGVPPEWAIQRWESLKRDLLKADNIFDADNFLQVDNIIYFSKDWKVWIDWYEDRIAGKTRSKAIELTYVGPSNEHWAQGPAVVNEWIKRRIEELEAPVPPDTDLDAAKTIPQIPQPGPGPRFQVGDGGLIERASFSDVDADGNDVRTINQLKPLVQRCASDLKARLSRNEFPELLISVEQYSAALDPGVGLAVNWGEVWGLGVLLQNAASAAERRISERLLPALEDPASTALESLLTLHGPLVLATREGSELSLKAQAFTMTREQQTELRAASAQVAVQLTLHPDVITAPAANSVRDAVNAIGEGKHPERGSIYGLATVKNVSIALMGGAAAATPALIGAFLGSAVVGAMLGAPLSLVVVEAVKKSPAFTALVTQLGVRLDGISDIALQAWLEERARRLAPFRSFVIANEAPLRKIAETTAELKWMLRYIDFVVGQD